jgi:hypothetical protein
VKKRRHAHGAPVWVAVQSNADAGRVAPGVVLSFDHGVYVVRSNLCTGTEHIVERIPTDLYPRDERDVALVGLDKS